MKREEFAKRIHWPVIIFIVSLLNAGSLLPQLYQIIITKNIDGLSLSTFIIVLVVQIGYALEFYFLRKKMLMVFLILAALINSTIITLILFLSFFSATHK